MSKKYPARLDVAYPEKVKRLSALFRPILGLPILVVLLILTADGQGVTKVVDEFGDVIRRTEHSIGGVGAGIFFATALMLLFRQKYPRWWFDFSLELTRFSSRVIAYFALLTDQYPSTDEPQGVNLELDYPNAKRDLNRALPLVKWFLAIPHYLVLLVLVPLALLATLVSWVVTIFTGRYPKPLHTFVVGVGRWCLRVSAYAFLLVTDDYPPFRLDP